MTGQQHAAAQNESELVEEEIGNILEEIDLMQEKVGSMSRSRFIRGRTLEDWEKQFELKMDYQSTPIHVNMLLETLTYNLDVAYRNYNQCKFERALYNSYFLREKGNRVEIEANRKGRKTPSLQTLEVLAETGLGEKSLAKDYYDFELEFWEKIIKKIVTQKELVNILSMSNGTRYKIGEPGM